ncbi:MAG: DUF952 domain-containing protein [Rhodospirillales bacterium]|nr:DUF952 domain-containing protein [Rhodospirillales bacterium]
MSVRHIYHLCRSEDWQAGAAQGRYGGGATDQGDGFIHFSTASQIADSAARHRPGERGLLLLTVRIERLPADLLRWEIAGDGGLYPHLYGPLPIESVVEVTALALGEDGLHEFPPIED